MHYAERLGMLLVSAAIVLGAIGFEIAVGQRKLAWLGGSIMLLGVIWLIAIGYSALSCVVYAFPTHNLALGVVLFGWYVLPRKAS